MKKDLRMLGELRKGPLRFMDEDEYKMIEEDVKKFGFKGLSGYAKSQVQEAMRRMAVVIEKAISVKVGDMVSWDASGGKAEGKVLRIENSGRINVPDSSFNIQGTEDDPAVLISLYRDGKPTDTKVGHKMSTLKKKQFYLNTETTTNLLMAIGVEVMILKVKIHLSQRTTYQATITSQTKMIPKVNSVMGTTIILSTWILWIIQERKKANCG